MAATIVEAEIFSGCTAQSTAPVGGESTAGAAATAVAVGVLHSHPVMRRGGLLLLFLLVPLAALAQRAWRATGGVGARPTGSAEWIWARGIWWRHASPSTLWAVRDFELAAAPRSGRLAVVADEEYVAFLNGERVGSGRLRHGPVDAYEVAPLLRSGGNRLVLELHSEPGSGGALAALDVDGKPRVWTDGRWTILRELSAAQLSGFEPLPAGEPALSWGLPPIGRWPVPQPGPARPAGWQLARGAWIPASGRTVEVGSTLGGEPGEAMLFEWPRRESGFLRLRVAPDPGRGAALLFYGDTPPDTTRRRADEVILAPPGNSEWRSAVARSFRYALVLGQVEGVAAWIEPAVGTALSAGTPADRGVFGIAPPTLRAPMQDEIRRELEGLPRIPGREEG